MANLRADNLTGTGGRNALDGSLFFNRGTSTSAEDYLSFSGISVGTSDFTIEGWLYKTKTENYPVIVDTRESGNTDAAGFFFGTDSSGYLYYYTQSTNAIKNTIISDHCWNHFALVRASNTTTLYINGVSSGTYSDANDYTRNITRLGSSQNTGVANNWDWGGYLSNVRITIGTAVYTAAFTPPTEKLEALANTKLLCCQDSDDPTQEETGRTITAHGGFRQDKSEGNLLTNTLDWTGSASSYSTTMPEGWTAGNGAQVQYESGGTSGGEEDRMLRLRNDGSSSYISQTIPTVSGQKYQIDLWYEAQNSSLAVKWSAGTSAGSDNMGSEQWNVGSDGTQATRTGTFNATATTTYINFQIISGTNDASVFVDDIQVRAVNFKAPKVIPPYGVDSGVTFEGDTKINSQCYMYFPTGTTEERSRGRGVIVAGENPSQNTSISYVQIQSGGNANDFGDLTKNCGENKAVGSSTRGVLHLSGDNPATRDTLEYITFATTSNSIDFGDLNVAWWMRAAAGNETRGIFAGGLYPGSDMKNDIDYITIASKGDATDFGNLTEAKNAAGGLASSTRMIIGGGQSPTSNPNTSNTIEYITIASTGNGTNFGDLTVIGKEIVAVANSIRGVFGPRRSNPAIVNTIDYITIATLGDAVDFGDGSTARGGAASLSNSTRGAWAGGYTPSLTNSMEYVDIATTGNAKDFGDLTYNSQYSGGCSDSHGGLS